MPERFKSGERPLRISPKVSTGAVPEKGGVDAQDAFNTKLLLGTKEALEKEGLPLTMRNYSEQSGLSVDVIRRLTKINLTLKFKLKIEKERRGPKKKRDDEGNSTES